MRAQKPIFRSDLKSQLSVRKPSLSVSAIGTSNLSGTNYSSERSNVGDYMKNEGNFAPQVNNSMEKTSNYNAKVAEALS